MKDTEQNCMNCRFQRDGDCHLRPAEMVPVPGAGGYTEVIPCYPPACDQDWCGEWTPTDGDKGNDCKTCKFLDSGTSECRISSPWVINGEARRAFPIMRVGDWCELWDKTNAEGA